MIGDGDVNGNVWAAMESLRLMGSYQSFDDVVLLLYGVCRTGGKVTSDVLTAIMKKYPTVLHSAAKYSLDVVKSLVETGADVNKRGGGCTPLHYVEDAAIAQYLVESKADLSIRDHEGRTPLGSASKCNRFAVASYLHSVGAPE
jgi:ankyrin repeat protein